MKTTDLMKSWVGKNEKDGSFKEIIDIYNSHTPYARGVKATYTMAWCAITISAMAIKLGLTEYIPTECGCERMIELCKKLGIWIEDDAYVPHEGDIIFYDWQDSGVGDNKGWSDHVGYVVSCNNNLITCIEGNKNDKVEYREIAVNAKFIRGYASPKYPDSVKTETVQAKPVPPVAKPVAGSGEQVTMGDVIAKQVINGAWGNGNDRKTRLTNAGYNYAEIQSRVNAILNGTTLETVAKQVINGKFGNGNTRKTKLKQAGYDYDVVQSLVNQMLK